MRDGFDVSPRSGENAGFWFLKIITGFLVILILLVHLIVNHLVVEGGLLTYNDVVQYYQNPLIPIMEIAFLVIVVSHALMGLRSVLLDLHPTDKILKVLNYGFIIIGVGAITYGTWLILVITGRGD